MGAASQKTRGEREAMSIPPLAGLLVLCFCLAEIGQEREAMSIPRSSDEQIPFLLRKASRLRDYLTQR